jgi:hypothetical protein
METLTDVSQDATPEHWAMGNALQWYTKLQRICRTIHLAKSALTAKRLSDRQAGAAAILIRQIESCVEHLGETTQRACRPGGVPTSARIDNELSDLSLLCEELVAAVVGRTA